MRALIDGVDGGSIELFKAEDVTKQLVVLNSDGSVKDCLLGTVQMLVYDTPDRRNTVTKTISAVGVSTGVSEAIGAFTLPLTPTILNFGPGRYWGFVRYTNSGATTFDYAENSFSMTIR